MTNSIPTPQSSGRRHLALAGWVLLFFGLHWAGVAFGEIVRLWLAIAAFRPVSRVAAWLLAPCLAWVSVASVLNFAFWRLNS